MNQKTQKQIFAFTRLLIYLAIAYYSQTFLLAFLIQVSIDCLNNYVFMPIVLGMHKVQEGMPVLFQRSGYNVIVHAITKGEIQSIEELKMQVLQYQPKSFSRFRSKIVYFLNNYYLKEVKNQQEYSKLFGKAFIEVNDEFSNEQDVLEYIRTKVGPIRFNHDELQFKMFLIKKFVPKTQKGVSQTVLNHDQENYENKSCVIFFYNHVITDGIGGFLALSAIQDKLDLDNLPMMRTKPWHQTAKDMLIGLFFPFYNSKMEEALDKSLLTNPILQFVKNQSGYYITKGYEIGEIKKITQQLKCTINDLCMTAVGLAFRNYADKHQLHIKDRIQIGVAVSIRNKPNHKEDITFNNQIRGQKSHVKIPYSTSAEDILACLQEHKQCGNEVRDMPYPYGRMFKTRVTTYLMPLFVLEKAGAAAMNEASTFTSNISGQPKPIKLGKNAFTERLHFVSPSSQNDFNADIKALGFNVMSHNNTLRMSINYAHINIDGKDIIQFIESAFDELRSIAKLSS
eukprot:403374786